MSESIPALIAEAREHAEALMPKQPVVGLIRRLADALESLSASPGDDEREALESVVAEAIAGAVDLAQVDAVAGPVNAAYWKSRIATLAVDACRRPSPVTREALEPTADLVDQLRSIECYYGGDLRDWMRDAVKLAADRLSLPEPAEVEWEYGVEDNIAEGGIDEGYSSEERALLMAAYRTSRYVTPGARAWAVKRRPAGDWVPVKGTEQ